MDATRADPAGAQQPRADAFPLDLADRCVKCGLCLPHCPTYVLTEDEGDSPRGRIALMQGLATGALPFTPRLAAHLDRCLTCRRCEAVCPAGVPYGTLIDAIRVELERVRPQPRRRRLARRAALAALIPHRRRLRALGRVLRLYQRSGLRALARRTGLLAALGLGRADASLPPLPRPPRWAAEYPPTGPARGAVALFTGCIAEITEPGVTRAAIEVLTALGFRVHVPDAQTCCGALHQHLGEPAGAQALAERNRRAFDALEVDAVLFTASGCGAQLLEHRGLAGQATLRAPVGELCAFLDAADWSAVGLRPLAERVALHTPCTHANVVGDAEAPARVLARIPGLEVRPLAWRAGCCGAAGSYVLTEPAMADALRADALDAAGELAPAALASTNVGCALHLSAGLRERGAPIEVLHPVELVAQQLAPSS